VTVACAVDRPLAPDAVALIGAQGTPERAAAAQPAGDRGMIAGTVLDAATQQPIVGARIRVGQVNAITNGAGNFRVVIAAGEHVVSVTAPGYADQEHAGVVVTADGTVVVRAQLTRS
jgi:hypothetical protein